MTVDLDIWCAGSSWHYPSNSKVEVIGQSLTSQEEKKSLATAGNGMVERALKADLN